MKSSEGRILWAKEAAKFQGSEMVCARPCVWDGASGHREGAGGDGGGHRFCRTSAVTYI